MTVTDTRTDLTQCTYTTDKGRRCKLHPNHVNIPGQEKHRMVLRDQVAKPPTAAELRRNGVKLDLTMQAVPKGESVSREYHREAAPRDADQLKVDKDAKTAYDAWVKARKPVDEGKMPWQRYIFPPAATDTVVGMLRSATTGGGPVAGKSLRYRRKTHESGNAMLYFVITDRIVDANTQQSITGQRG